LSLSEFSLVNPSQAPVGFQNYIALLSDSIFWKSIQVTLFLVFGSVVIEFVVGIFLALLITSSGPRARSIFSSIFIIPIAIAPIVVGILWSPNSVFDDLNTLLYYGLSLGVYIDTTRPFIYYSLIMISDAYIWAPLLMLVTVAIIRSIPREQYEAAEVMGASSWTKFNKITFPAIISSPAIIVTLLLRMADAFRMFEIPYAWNFWLGQDSELGASVDTVSVLMWKMFSSTMYDFPIAQITTIAIVLLIMTLSICALVLKRSSSLLD
jgi:ABC-type sugar transport system permease subunit